MLRIGRGFRCAFAGRHASLLHGTARTLPRATDLAPSCAFAWGSFGSSRALVASSRSFSQIPDQEQVAAVNKPQKTKFYRQKKHKVSAEELAKRGENLTKLKASPKDADEIFATIQSANGSGLSKEVATMLMTTFVKEAKLDKALLVLELANKRKVPLRGPPYEMLITSCYQAKDLEAALKVFELVQSANVSPSSLTYTTGLLSAHKLGKSELLPRTLGSMLKDAKPYTSQAFQAALSAAVKSNQHQLVLDIVECSKTLDVELTSEHYHSVLRSCAAVGNMKVALGMRDTLQQNGLSMTDDGFYWLVHCACRANQWELVQGLLTPGDKE
ncbi:unnamed protein product [Phytophthora lilii]|uniref:Unnamed protein product n=1 Tax=Phytophthora lilii TaxID=2077276 RepID=A0A9W6UAU6_9STRA|nr:unnamed protein product [Phytophthora lilii]